MNKRILLAYTGGQDVNYLLSLLTVVAKREESAIGYYIPNATSKQACAMRAYVAIGEQTSCKEMLPETADVLLALEELEGRRAVRFVAKEGVVLLCAAHRLPMSVAVGTTGYPTDILYRCVNEGRKVWQIKRKECTEGYISAMLLRALGYDESTTSTVLSSCGLSVKEEELHSAFDKKYSE